MQYLQIALNMQSAHMFPFQWDNMVNFQIKSYAPEHAA